jgi:hypothetical protein
MKWTAISGSWRTVDDHVEADVRAAITDIISRGDGIVTGGALGVDYIATDEALKNDPRGQHIRVILPTSLTDYANHFFQRAKEGVITQQQAQLLIRQLRDLKHTNPDAVQEMGYTACTPKTYYARNTEVLNAASALLAFQVNGSAGTQDTIDKAQARGMPIHVRKYTIS